jgi:hypothetical protein
MSNFRNLTTAYNDLRATAWTNNADPLWFALWKAIESFRPDDTPVTVAPNPPIDVPPVDVTPDALTVQPTVILKGGSWAPIYVVESGNV